MIWIILTAAPASAATCEGLASLKLPQITITGANTVAQSKFVLPTSTPNLPTLEVFKNLPAFCRVRGTIRPSIDSDIEFEIWLPSSDKPSFEKSEKRTAGFRSSQPLKSRVFGMRR